MTMTAGLRALPVTRGCGTRKAGATYLECGPSEHGLPLEAFLVDPPIVESDGFGASEWFKPHRTPIWYERMGVNHLVIWVGAEHYENVFDFIEEVRVAGVSRRVPSQLDFSKIGPLSRMIFVHPQAAVTPTAELSSKPTLCPKNDGPVSLHETWMADTRCLGGAKYLAKAGADGWVRLPCGASYQPGLGAPFDLPVQPGIFLQTPITGVAMITGHDGSVDREKQERVSKAGVPVFTSDQ